MFLNFGIASALDALKLKEIQLGLNSQPLWKGSGSIYLSLSVNSQLKKLLVGSTDGNARIYCLDNHHGVQKVETFLRVMLSGLKYSKP